VAVFGRSEDRRIDPVVMLSLGLVVLALLHLLTGALPASRRLDRMRSGNAAAMATLRESQQERLALETRRDALETDAFTVERELRRIMNLVLPGEVMVLPPERIRR
jgi:septal ring factor EnvC (AmiA/AmiB activator)